MIQTNDRPMIDGYVDGWLNLDHKVSSTAAASITLTTTPNTAALSKRLQLWIRNS